MSYLPEEEIMKRKIKTIRRGRKNVAKAQTMERGSRSAAVRDYLKENPSASPKKVVAALKETGIEVSEGLVSVIKYRKPTAGAGRRGRRASLLGSGGEINASTLLEIKRVVDSLGGIEKAREALSTLEQLQ